MALVRVKLSELSVSAENTGWREIEPARVAELVEIFKGGGFGRSSSCGVSILEEEDSEGAKLIDDGVSTVLALLQCTRRYEAEQLVKGPAGVPAAGSDWGGLLVEIFETGLQVLKVEYPAEFREREWRQAWNIEKHNEDTHSIRWSSTYEKIMVPLKIFKVLGDWTEVGNKMRKFYGEHHHDTSKRWLRSL